MRGLAWIVAPEFCPQASANLAVILQQGDNRLIQLVRRDMKTLLLDEM